MAGALALVEAALVQEAAAVPEMPPHDHDLLHGRGAHRCPLAPRLLAPLPLTAQNLGLALPRRRNHIRWRDYLLAWARFFSFLAQRNGLDRVDLSDQWKPKIGNRCW